MRHLTSKRLVLTLALCLLAASSPYGAHAAGVNLSYLTQYKTAVVSIVNDILMPIVFALSFIAFIYGVANAYILHPGDDKRVAQGHQMVLWGLIGFVVILSVWGLVNIARTTLMLDTVTSTAPAVPTL